MATDFTVQELFDLLARCNTPMNVARADGRWCLRATCAPLAFGTTPDELRKALEERAVPTEEEAYDHLRILGMGSYVLDVDDKRAQIAYRALCRYIEAREQPDGS